MKLLLGALIFAPGLGLASDKSDLVFANMRDEKSAENASDQLRRKFEGRLYEDPFIFEDVKRFVAGLNAGEEPGYATSGTPALSSSRKALGRFGVGVDTHFHPTSSGQCEVVQTVCRSDADAVPVDSITVFKRLVEGQCSAVRKVWLTAARRNIDIVFANMGDEKSAENAYDQLRRKFEEYHHPFKFRDAKGVVAGLNAGEEPGYATSGTHSSSRSFTRKALGRFGVGVSTHFHPTSSGQCEVVQTVCRSDADAETVDFIPIFNLKQRFQNRCSDVRQVWLDGGYGALMSSLLTVSSSSGSSSVLSRSNSSGSSSVLSRSNSSGSSSVLSQSRQSSSYRK